LIISTPIRSLMFCSALPNLPAFAGSHGCEVVEECGAGFRRTFGEVLPKLQQGPRFSTRGAPPNNKHSILCAFLFFLVLALPVCELC